MINDPLSRPLKFGDQEQIDAIRNLAIKNEYLEIPECPDCEGNDICECDCGCETCCKECITCAGDGKDPELLKAFQIKYPNWRR